MNGQFLTDHLACPEVKLVSSPCCARVNRPSPSDSMLTWTAPSRELGCAPPWCALAGRGERFHGRALMLLVREIVPLSLLLCLFLCEFLSLCLSLGDLAVRFVSRSVPERRPAGVCGGHRALWCTAPIVRFPRESLVRVFAVKLDRKVYYHAVECVTLSARMTLDRRTYLVQRALWTLDKREYFSPLPLNQGKLVRPQHRKQEESHAVRSRFASDRREYVIDCAFDAWVEYQVEGIP